MNKSRLRSSSRHESIEIRACIYIYINGFLENEERKNRDSNFVVARGIRN